MKKGLKDNGRNLTELEIQRLKEQRTKIITSAVMASVGIVDLALLKMLSDTIGTDDMTASDYISLFLGGGASYLGVTLTAVNMIDYSDMKKEIFKTEKAKKKIRKNKNRA